MFHNDKQGSLLKMGRVLRFLKLLLDIMWWPIYILLYQDSFWIKKQNNKNIFVKMIVLKRFAHFGYGSTSK